jgi:hypothetical protein
MTSRGWADLYAWQLDRASGTPLARQIAEWAREIPVVVLDPVR